ncbi:MAG: hypothetical protein IJO51_07590, partial [Clostridia bacterium]|nr:hypothetical protein [Clostridia bacterium]
YKNITITAEDNWTYELKRLNDDYEWTFVEETVEGFTVSTEMHRDGRYIITNTWNGLEEPEIPEEPENPAEPPAPPVEPEQPELPATGALWWPVPLMAVLGIACFLMGWMRRRNYEN